MGTPKAARRAKEKASRQILDGPSPQERETLTALFNQGRYQEAGMLARGLTARFPRHGFGWKALGAALGGMGHAADAVVAMEKAASLVPNDPELQGDLAVVYRRAGRLKDAESAYRRLLSIRPDLAEAQNNLGNTLCDLERFDEAEAAFRAAIQIQPGCQDAHFNLANVLRDQGRIHEAIASYRMALELAPDDLQAHSNLLLALNYANPIDTESCRSEARRYAEAVARKTPYRFTEWACRRDPERLRLGFVSGDLRSHPVGYLIEGLLRGLDATRIEAIAYPTNPATDTVTNRLKNYFAAWKPIHGFGDEGAARRIHDDGVHILIDLTGHTAHNRLPVFALKPAPVQVSWLGYFATTGLAEMDYVLTDPWSTPSDRKKDFTETLWQLPETRLCFAPPPDEVPCSSLPPALENGYVTFGCFNNMTKINDDVIALWAHVLDAVPNSRLLLKAHQLGRASCRDRILKRFAANGISPSRLMLEGPTPHHAYLATYHRLDIALDPFPFSGGMTSIDSLWMGVPILTLQGSTLVSRQGTSILANAGLHDWIAKDKDDYIAKAIHHAKDVDRLLKLRSGMRPRLLDSPLCNTKRFASHFESAMWDMWRRHVAS